MCPARSVSGLYPAHPESKYFAVGKLGRDHVFDYRLPKRTTMQDVEKWLGLYLNYEPVHGLPASTSAASACRTAR
jgi:5-methyltetrahydrofolate--homocysteine methyltransferase